jgi:hypothetical protein
VPRWNAYVEGKLSALTHGLRRKRVENFVRKLRLGPNDLVLDLGSEDGSYLAGSYPYPHNIVLADLDEEPMRTGVQKFGLRDYIVLSLDGTIPAGDRHFNAVWCNSVIEHVTVDRALLPSLSDREFRRRADEHQRRFASEIARVAEQYFVQTPYVHFPIESHAWLPGIQYLSQPTRLRLSRLLRRGWIKQWTPEFYLYDVARLREHYPDATALEVERFLGLPKSLIVMRVR